MGWAGHSRMNNRVPTFSFGGDAWYADGHAVFSRERGDVVSLRRGRAGGAHHLAPGLFAVTLPEQLPGGGRLREENCVRGGGGGVCSGVRQRDF